ncbi:hypothetical protein [Marinobacterium maritimum]
MSSAAVRSVSASPPSKRCGKAICEYTVRAAEKLRQEKQMAKRICIFMRTNRFNQAEPQYMPSVSAELPFPANDTRDFVEAAMRLLRASW